MFFRLITKLFSVILFSGFSKCKAGVSCADHWHGPVHWCHGLSGDTEVGTGAANRESSSLQPLMSIILTLVIVDLLVILNKMVMANWIRATLIIWKEIRDHFRTCPYDVWTRLWQSKYTFQFCSLELAFSVVMSSLTSWPQPPAPTPGHGLRGDTELDKIYLPWSVTSPCDWWLQCMVQDILIVKAITPSILVRFSKSWWLNISEAFSASLPRCYFRLG